MYYPFAGGIIVGSTMPEVVTYYLSGLSHSCRVRKFVSDCAVFTIIFEKSSDERHLPIGQWSAVFWTGKWGFRHIYGIKF